jgi:NAD+ diphosphatase
MLGCHAVAEGSTLTVDASELEDARWFTRAEVAEALDRGEESTSFIGPPAQAIAHSLLAWWLEETA